MPRWSKHSLARLNIARDLARKRTGAQARRLRSSQESSRSKPSSILDRRQKGLHHLGLVEITVEPVQFVQPEVVPVEVPVGRVIRISSQVTEILHQDKRAVEFLLHERLVLCDSAQDARAGSKISRCFSTSELVDDTLAIADRRR